MTAPATTLRSAPPEPAQRIEELGRIILAYSEVTDRLEQSHTQLVATVETLRRELIEKDRLLERKNRLTALGEMAAGMAHEIRNPLGGIQLYASMLADDLSAREELSGSLQLVTKIAGGVRRLEGLVGQVLQFTREIAANAVPMDLAACVAQSVEYAAGAMADRRVTCAVQGPDPMPVSADPLLVGQAILNLLLNAAEAMPDGGAVRVHYGPPTPGSNAKRFHLVVRDGGPGIPPQVMEKLFNPFFTTKETGTGLGLSIVHRIVEAHDGTILVTNPPGGGARFEMRV